MFNRKCIFKWWIFYCHVSFRGSTPKWQHIWYWELPLSNTHTDFWIFVTCPKRIFIQSMTLGFFALHFEERYPDPWSVGFWIRKILVSANLQGAFHGWFEPFERGSNVWFIVLRHQSLCPSFGSQQWPPLPKLLMKLPSNISATITSADGDERQSPASPPKLSTTHLTPIRSKTLCGVSRWMSWNSNVWTPGWRVASECWLFSILNDKHVSNWFEGWAWFCRQVKPHRFSTPLVTSEFQPEPFPYPMNKHSLRLTPGYLQALLFGAPKQ